MVNRVPQVLLSWVGPISHFTFVFLRPFSGHLPGSAKVGFLFGVWWVLLGDGFSFGNGFWNAFGMFLDCFLFFFLLKTQEGREAFVGFSIFAKPRNRRVWVVAKTSKKLLTEWIQLEGLIGAADFLND